MQSEKINIKSTNKKKEKKKSEYMPLSIGIVTV